MIIKMLTPILLGEIGEGSYLQLMQDGNWVVLCNTNAKASQYFVKSSFLPKEKFEQVVPNLELKKLKEELRLLETVSEKLSIHIHDMDLIMVGDPAVMCQINRDEDGNWVIKKFPEGHFHAKIERKLGESYLTFSQLAENGVVVRKFFQFNDVADLLKEVIEKKLNEEKRG